jgi:hypothetical protein|nr:MAG TPA: hypothetical protein [Caudoviricetes sp.]
MEIKLPNGTGVVTNDKGCIEMYLKMGGVEVKKSKGRTQKEPPKENTKEPPKEDAKEK